MIELLVIPDWNTPERTLEDWVSRLSEVGGPVVVTRESVGASWIEIASLRLRGYAVIEGPRLEAINFELTALDPDPALRVIEAVSKDLGWEVHPDEPDLADDPEDPDDE
ncbi:hypothetical protein ACYOEI_16815 [Singulisphaera rosea]